MVPGILQLFVAKLRLLPEPPSVIFIIRALRWVEVAVSMTAARRVPRGCFGRRPAKTAFLDHCLDARLGCYEGQVCRSRDVALLYPIPDWPALSVACVILASVRPGKSRS